MQNEKLRFNIIQTFEKLNNDPDYFLNVSSLTRKVISQLLDLDDNQQPLSVLRDFEEYHKIIQVIIHWEYIHRLTQCHVR